MFKWFIAKFRRKEPKGFHWGLLGDVTVPLGVRVIYMAQDEPTKREMERLWVIDQRAMKASQKA